MAAVDTSMWQNLARQQQSPMDLFGHLLELKNLAQQNQAGKLELQSKQIDVKAKQQASDDDQKLRTALSTSLDASGNPNWDNFKKNAIKAGVSPRTLSAMDDSRAATVDKLAKAHETDLKNLAQQDDMFRGYTTKIMTASPELRPQLYQWAIQDAVNKGIMKPGQAPAQYPGDQVFEAMHTSLALGSQLAKEADDKRQRDIVAGTQAETARHNVAEEQGQDLQRQLMKRGQDITMRGQDITKRGQDLAHSTDEQPLTPAQASLVDEIGTGKMALNRVDYVLSRNPSLAGAVAQKYPDFDSSKVKSYTQAYQSFTSGADAKQINSGAVALQHLKQLKDLNDNNPGAVRVPGTAANKAYNNLLDTVADELVTFYGEPKTNESIAAKKSTLGGLTNRDAAITEQANAMGVKFDEMEQKWQNAAPSRAYQAPLPGISPQAQSARAALDPEYAKRIAPQAAGGQPGPQQGEISATGPNGHKIVVRGGRWVDAVTGRPMQ